jgi:hypothetical protein
LTTNVDEFLTAEELRDAEQHAEAERLRIYDPPAYKALKEKERIAKMEKENKAMEGLRKEQAAAGKTAWSNNRPLIGSTQPPKAPPGPSPNKYFSSYTAPLAPQLGQSSSSIPALEGPVDRHHFSDLAKPPQSNRYFRSYQVPGHHSPRVPRTPVSNSYQTHSNLSTASSLFNFPTNPGPVLQTAPNPDSPTLQTLHSQNLPLSTPKEPNGTSTDFTRLSQPQRVIPAIEDIADTPTKGAEPRKKQASASSPTSNEKGDSSGSLVRIPPVLPSKKSETTATDKSLVDLTLGNPLGLKNRNSIFKKFQKSNQSSRLGGTDNLGSSAPAGVP